MGKSSYRKLRNVFLNIFYRVVLLKTPLNDVFCMEIAGTKKAPFDFEQELLNQAKVMSAAFLSGNRVVSIKEI